MLWTYPGFPRERAPTLGRGWVPNYYSTKFSRKLHKNEKNGLSLGEGASKIQLFYVDPSRSAVCSGADPGFGQGGAPATEAESCRHSEASILRPGSRALEAFGFLMPKYAFSHILETLFLLFLTSILTPKVDKNRALDFTSINLRHSDMLLLFFNLHEKVML